MQQQHPSSYTPTQRKEKKAKRVVRWRYWEDSQFYAKCLESNGTWSKPIGSHDVPNKSIARGTIREFPPEEKLRRLQKCLENGGTKGNSIAWPRVQFAYISERGKSAKDAVLIYTPMDGWHQPKQKPECHQPSGWKLWMPAEPKNINLIGHWDDPNFLAFCQKIVVEHPETAEKYADHGTGEIFPDFLMAAWLGQSAILHADSVTRAHIYYEHEFYFKINMRTGRLESAAKRVCPDIFLEIQRNS